MESVVTRIRRNHVLVDDKYQDVVVIITSTDELTIEELQIIADNSIKLVSQKKMLATVQEKIRKMFGTMKKPAAVAIKYANVLKKVQNISYEIL